jgi:hypothetical protein
MEHTPLPYQEDGSSGFGEEFRPYGQWMAKHVPRTLPGIGKGDTAARLAEVSQ